MGLVSKARAKKIMIEAVGETDPRALELTKDLEEQFHQFHLLNLWDDRELEEILIDQKRFELDNSGWFKADVPLFSPSSSSKCERELCFKCMKATRDGNPMQPYQKRWVRNSTAVHEATQRDILYMTKKMENPPFKIMFNELGLPMWEKNNAQIKYFNHNGVDFAIAGMMDGQLEYKDGSTIGFEFKTKSNSVAQVGNYKMKGATESHILQCTAYSLLFGMDEFIIMYEAVAKDSWMKGAEARADIRMFYVKVTEEDQINLLDKFSRVASAVNDDRLQPLEAGKCLFCEYKGVCGV